MARSQRPSIPVNRILQGDCIRILQSLPDASVDLVFADPPYNLQLRNELYRPNMTRVEAVTDAWDQFGSLEAYDRFSEAWLRECRRVLKKDGTLWVIGSYHNIFRLGKIIQDLGFWILNDVIWIKTNPMPNFRGVRFTNAHETLIWAAREKKSRYVFNHHAMKSLNGDLQMRSDWLLPICNGNERLRENGKKVHSTQKPEALLYRVILSSTDPGDLVLDPFFGTGTTGAVAKVLHRRWIGIEREARYVEVARKRIEAVQAEPYDPQVFDVRDRRRRERRIPFATLLERGLLRPGQELYFQRDRKRAARVKPDGRLYVQGFEGSIHQAAKHLAQGRPCNGWEHWYYLDEEGALRPLDALRRMVRADLQKRQPAVVRAG